jgi:Ion channel
MVRTDPPRSEGLIQRLERIGEAYGLVLIMILTTFVVTMTLPPTGWAGRVAAVAISGATAVVALISSDVRVDRVRTVAAGTCGAVGLAVLARVLDSRPLLGVAFLIDGVLLTIAAGTILRRVVTAVAVNFRTILGAISVYTLQGLLFSYLFLALGRLQDGAVFTGQPSTRPADYLFFSYTTLTTTGYGNLVPAGDVGKVLAVFEMLTGQIFLVTLVAGLVSLWRPGRPR